LEREERRGWGNREYVYVQRFTVPVLVNHHYAEEYAQCEEKKAVDVVLDSVADGSRE
jgi:hypothetical protein